MAFFHPQPSALASNLLLTGKCEGQGGQGPGDRINMLKCRPKGSPQRVGVLVSGLPTPAWLLKAFFCMYTPPSWFPFTHMLNFLDLRMTNKRPSQSEIFLLSELNSSQSTVVSILVTGTLAVPRVLP